jgi:hypothetical protein
MSIYKDVNYKRLSPVNTQDGDIFDNCNIAQLYPHTGICVDKIGLTFKGCNLLNCDIPAGSTVEDCLMVHKSFCSHIHPEFELSPACTNNCSHVVDIDEVWIDSVLIDTIYHYEDTII